MKKIKIAICGLGRAGWGMHMKELDRYPEMFEVSGVYDILEDRMDLACKRYATCRKFNSFEEMINDKDIELITVANRSPQHIEYVIKALQTGKYVFAEKPIAVNYAELEKLQTEAGEYLSNLFCRQNRRFEAAFQHITEIIKSKKLGDVYEIKLCRHNFNRRSDWQTLHQFAGGQLNNWGPHLIDHALQFLDYDVEYVWGDVKQIAASGDVNDHFKAIFRSSKGLIVDVEVSAGVAIKSPVYSVYGTKGSLIAETEKEFKLKYLDLQKCAQKPVADPNTPNMPAPYDKETVQTSKTINEFGNGDKLEWIEEVITCGPSNGSTVDDIYSHIYQSIRNGVTFPIKYEEAFEVVKITEKIYKSSINKQ